MEKKEVLAVVGKKEITQNDLDSALNSLGPQRAMQFNSEEGRKKLLEDLVNQELFYLDSIENKVDEEESFKAEMEKIKENFLKQYSINKLLSSVTVEENEINDFYNNNKAQFKAPESVKASHILVEEESKAEDILKELHNGLSFEDAAKKYSKCPSNERGGNLGYFAKGQMVPEFEKTAFDMKKDEISNPVKTQFGYHIIKVYDKKEEEIKPLSEVRNQIAQQILYTKQQSVYFTKVNELKGKYEVKINL
ncbi:peptidylprolyl isomerase [Tepidibacter formicigenes]|jgi:peptidyl-prolyl cis-trans isomerase C|uniref:Peptidyl-prolyl cis-trans isomerase C n=1 Tax=Tepidibacter formicigenes DSM 15518 TaxID=1123349 RepID=A0A1M6RPX6_9FIRM|nr:peptidylprolyl isomerase [Tepidibacter formicigenes]SHK34532.1 peptidyl-prolyl cis-trans isomerase C [Tepidibacter formicigenes DSM 15518]